MANEVATLLWETSLDLAPPGAVMLGEEKQLYLSPLEVSAVYLAGTVLDLSPSISPAQLLASRIISLSLPSDEATFLDSGIISLSPSGTTPSPIVPDGKKEEGINWWLWGGIGLIVVAIVIAVIAARRGK